MDEGWTRFVFEKEAGVDYETLHDPDVKAGGLAERFDAIVVPDQPLASIKGGHAAGTMPEGYVGGLGARERRRSRRSFTTAAPWWR